MSSDMSTKVPPIGLIVCGPCACGKSEVASALADHYQVTFVDADTYHSEENIKKMSTGTPLTDQDRFPWLARVRQEMILQQSPTPLTSKVSVVAACSALTKSYRDILRGKDSPQSDLTVIFVFLNCSEAVLQQRLNQRQGHFMKANMLSSQLAALEIPNEEAQQSQAVIVNGDAKVEDVIDEATSKLIDLTG